MRIVIFSLLLAILLSFSIAGKSQAYGGSTPGFPPPAKVKLVCTFIPYTLPNGKVIKIPKCKLVKIDHITGEHRDFSERLSDFFDRIVNGNS